MPLAPEYVSPSTIARRLDVDTRSVRRWCASGLVKCWTTPTGHYRVEVGVEGRPVNARPPPQYGRKRLAS